MNRSQLREELFSQLAEPLVGEQLFDCFSDLVFFVKNQRGEYVVVNQTLVDRCGRHEKKELLGRRADELFAAPLGQSYREQDETVLRTGQPVLDELELHAFPTGARGWCITNKMPLLNRSGQVVGLVGISKDLHIANERAQDYAGVAKVIRHIQTHYSEPLRVKDLAAMAGLSEYQFEQRIRKIFQITPGQLIQKTRMDAAVERLRNTAEPIAQIAVACGYADQSAFTRQFRQTVGLSPSEFRAA